MVWKVCKRAANDCIPSLDDIAPTIQRPMKGVYLNEMVLRVNAKVNNRGATSVKIWEGWPRRN